MFEINEYLDERGRSRFGQWFNGLDSRVAARVRITLARIETGNLSNVRGVGSGVLERRIHFGPGYWIYFGKDGDSLIILLAGGAKRRQQRDVEEARQLWLQYKQRR